VITTVHTALTQLSPLPQTLPHPPQFCGSVTGFTQKQLGADPQLMSPTTQSRLQPPSPASGTPLSPASPASGMPLSPASPASGKPLSPASPPS
jgi:hypothetical protein